MEKSQGRERFQQIVSVYQECKTLLVAVRLGIFTALAGRQMSAVELSAALELPAEPLELMLNALAAMDLLEKRESRFRSAPDAASFLADGGPDTLAPLFRHQDRMWDKWSGLEEKIRGRDREAASDPEAVLRDFIGAMEVNGRVGSRRVLAVLDLSGVRRLLDLGGGPGSYAASFARRWPEMEVTLFDHPETGPLAAAALAAEGVHGRVRFLGGDLFTDEIGAGYDAIWASNLVHSYGPGVVPEIIGICRKALVPGGRLILHDFFLDPERIRPRRAAVFALHMLVATNGGRTYSFDEMEKMMAERGFRAFTRLTATEQSGIIIAT